MPRKVSYMKESSWWNTEWSENDLGAHSGWPVLETFWMLEKERGASLHTPIGRLHLNSASKGTNVSLLPAWGATISHWSNPTGPKSPGHEQLAFPGNLFNSWYPKSRLPGVYYPTGEMVLRTVSQERRVTKVGVRSVHQNPHAHSCAPSSVWLSTTWCGDHRNSCFPFSIWNFPFPSKAYFLTYTTTLRWN